MPHCDAEWLALRALGEPVQGPDEEHLHGCAACQLDLAELSAVVRTARTVTAQDRPVDPPDAVWDRVAAELRPDHDRPLAPVLPLARRRRTLLVGAAAATVGLLVGSVATALVVRRSPATTVVARAELAPLPNQTATGTAVLSREGSAEVLSVAVPDLPASPTTFYEVWLLTPDASRLVSLGVLGPGDRGTFELPAGLDLHAYRVVDVSAEPLDGNPAHSADSIVRGTLPV